MKKLLTLFVALVSVCAALPEAESAK